MFIHLESVSFVINKTTLNVYPCNKQGIYCDTSMSHLNNCNDEWFNKLSQLDLIIINILVNIN